MKKSMKAIMVLCLLVIWGCTTDEGNFVEKEVKQNITKSIGNVPIPDIVNNQIVIQFNNPLLPSNQKQAIRDTIQARHKFTIQNIEVCDCDPNGPELWTIGITQTGFLGVEELVKNLDSNASEGGVEGDLQFYINISNNPLSGLYSSSMNSKIATNSSPDIVNIAILDTGIDYSYFSGQFLYNTQNTNNGASGISGWDFVNHDKDIQDDHGHGSIVAKVITTELDITNTPYNILSVKAFDKRGKATYFDVVCGMNYISKLTNIHIINMSFGWYGRNQQSILRNLMHDVKNNTLIITSAGNLGLNTDEIENMHFPSGYRLDNTIAIGGYELESEQQNHWGVQDILDRIIIHKSNYGSENINLVAPLDGYNLVFNTQAGNRIETVNPIGTSFSAAYVTAKVAELYDRELSVSDLKNQIMLTTHSLQRIQASIMDGNVLVRNH